ncbi:MAG: type II secretion system protein GspJ, partial [Tepidisphaeraceae bacterium]
LQHSDGTGEIKMIELTIDTPKGSSSPCLVRKVTGNLTDENLPAPDEEIICRGVSSFTLQYFDGENWNPTWDSTAQDNTLPVAVQATITLVRPQNNGGSRTLSFQRVYILPCSTAEQDSTVNTDVSASTSTQ